MLWYFQKRFIYRSYANDFLKSTSLIEYSVGVYTIATMHLWTFVNYKFTIFNVNKKALEYALTSVISITITLSLILWFFVFFTTFKSDKLRKERKWFCVNSAIFWLTLLTFIMNQNSYSIFTDGINIITALNILIITCFRKEVFEEYFGLFVIW